VTGRVDERLRALIKIPIAESIDGPRTEIEAWIDTAFTGCLTLPRGIAAELGLQPAAITEAILADGTRATFESVDCFLDWFECTYRTQVVLTDGELPLLGTQLLERRKLVIDYNVKSLELH
jgi:clan AA aspartic protease